MTSAIVELRSGSPDVTERYGAALGGALRAGDVLVLEGPLGAGKTCLVRGIVAGAGGDAAAVRSPTFVLHQPHRGATITVHHVDLYRLGAGASIEVLDLDTLLRDGAAVIEWGGYADLHELHPTRVSIDGGDVRHSERGLRMERGAAPHLVDAWAALPERGRRGVSVIAIDSASRGRAWALLVTADGAVIERREMPGGELDRRLPGVLAELRAGEVTAVVVLTGPGSYSGVRAGMAAALGFAAARSLPLHGLGTLTAIAMAANPADGTAFTVVADAGRGGVYAARFTRRGEHVEQAAPAQRVSADQVDTTDRVFAIAEITGLPTEQLEPIRVLAAAVPRALLLPPLDAFGLTAIHADSAATTD